MSQKRSLTRELHIAEKMPVDDFLVADTKKIKQKVHSSIDSPHPERRMTLMKTNMKYVFAAALAIVILATSAFASSNIIKQWNLSAAEEPEFLKLPTAEDAAKYVDFAPVLFEKFENGYTFESGSVVSNQMVNEDNQPVEEFNTLEFRYVKDGGDIYFWQSKCGENLCNQAERIAAAEDVDIYYQHQAYKVVPEDYKMTEDDKAKETSGELIFSWGAETVALHEVQSVSWTQDGVYFLLQQIDGRLSVDELVAMANEIIRE